MLKRKTLTALFAVALLTFIAAVSGIIGAATARAEEEPDPIIKFTYSEDDSTVITGIEAPAGEDYFKVVIPEKVTAIGANAFEGCDRLSGVTLNEELTEIGDYAFTGTSVSEIAIPSSVTKIGEHAFHGCVSLTDVTFAERTENLTISMYAFYGCTGLQILNVPADTEVRQNAFANCSSLSWVYVGNGATFKNPAGDLPDVVFFPTNNKQLTIIFPTEEAYNNALSQQDFKAKHESSSTYIVKVNCYIGSAETPVSYERLHGRDFNYVKDSSGRWNIDTNYSTLPVQASHYSETVWYTEDTLASDKKVSYEQVNDLLKTTVETIETPEADGEEKQTNDVIKLYCHATVSIPALPAEPVSWVYNSDTSYAVNDITQVLKALGCTQTLTDTQLNALNFKIVFADENGKVADTPDAICTNGVYSVTLSLNPEYGSWSQPITSTVTVNVNTSGFNVVLIVFLVIGILAVIITVSTAIIRKKVQERNKKKQLSQKEVLEKFKASGGETTLS